MKVAGGHLVFAALMYVAGINPTAAQDLDWYKQATYTCSGPTALPSVLSAIGYRPPMPFEVAPSNTVYVAVQAAQVLENGKPAAPVKIHTHTLDEAQATSLRDFYRRQSDTGLPVWADSTLAFLVGATLPTGASFAADAGYALFNDSLKAASINAEMTAVLLADGGRIERVVAPKLRNDSGLYVIVVDRYVTSVAEEARSIALRSCLLPAKIEVTKFRTRSHTNNKEVRNLGSTWIQYDLEESKTDFEMIYAGQDEEYFYFTRRADTRIRISTRGGAMQTERDGSWRTWYKETEAM